MRNDDLVATEDNFIFSVEDTKPNKLFNNIFKIQWTRIHFVSSIYNISETSGLIELPVKRTGNKQLVCLFYYSYFICDFIYELKICNLFMNIF